MLIMDTLSRVLGLGILAVVLSSQLCHCAVDPCLSYKTLPYSKRVLTYTSTPTETEECDRYLQYGSNWYRLDGNSASDLVTHCPDVGQCGTLYPVWLNGSTPSESEGIVTRTACQRGLLDEQCCAISITIKLKNCGSFRVAYLPILPGCPGKYCFQYKEPCPPGQSSETGYKPCTDAFAKLSDNAKAEVEPFIKSHDFLSPDRALFFRCRRLYDNARNSFYFDVDWYIDNKLVKNIPKVSYNSYYTDAVLREDSKWQLPMMVKCSYRARSLKNGVPSPHVMSESFFAGIKISQQGVIKIPEGSEGTITFRSTIPVPCVTEINGRPFLKDKCEIDFENNVNETHEGCFFRGPATAMVTLRQDCGFKIFGRNWNNPQTMHVKAMADGTARNIRNPAVIRLATPKSNPLSLHPLWLNYTLPEIKVITEDRNRVLMGKNCGAWTDVNIHTFDDGSFITDDPGWYLLYKHTEKPIEIMTVTEPNHDKQEGYRWGTVNCAVSVKAGSDVFMVYICKNKWIIKRMGCEHGSNLEVYDKQEAKSTMVILPTGTKVEIQFHPYYKNASWIYLQLYIYPSPDDYGKVTGLCGNLNNVPNDTEAQRHQFRLGDVIDSDAFSQAIAGTFSVSHQICLCPNDVNFKTELHPHVQCDWRTEVTCMRTKWNVKPCQYREKRDAHLDEENWVSHETRFNVIKRVARSTWTLSLARDKCLDVFLRYPSFNKCRELPEVDVNSVLDFCASDVVRSGETGWIPAALEVIKSQCINVLDVDTDLWVPTSPGATSKGETIFLEAKCPNECNDHGHCIAGVCKCSTDFVEEDCSVNLKLPPTTERLTRNGVCDLSNVNTSCSATHVYGYNFYNSDRLKCRLREIMLHETGLKVASTSTEQKAVFENFRQVMCTFPDTKSLSIPDRSVGVRGYHVEVSNNGAVYSKTLTFIASDPRCHDCDLLNMTCKRKVDSCLIDGKCYTAGEAKVTEPHMKCTPTVSGFTWTQEVVISRAVRLVGGPSKLEGRVELLHDGIWGTICSFAFDDIDATVICKMLGYDEKPGRAKALKSFGGGSGPIWFDDPDCNGSEDDIVDCPRMFKTNVPVWGTNTCVHSEDAGVRCSPKSTDPVIIG